MSLKTKISYITACIYLKKVTEINNLPVVHVHPETNEKK